MADDREVWLTASELAKVFMVKLPTVRLWTRQGIPCLRLGRHCVRFNPASVRRFFEQKQAQG